MIGQIRFTFTSADVPRRSISAADGSLHAAFDIPAHLYIFYNIAETVTALRNAPQRPLTQHGLSARRCRWSERASRHSAAPGCRPVPSQGSEYGPRAAGRTAPHAGLASGLRQRAGLGAARRTSSSSPCVGCTLPVWAGKKTPLRRARADFSPPIDARLQIPYLGGDSRIRDIRALFSAEVRCPACAPARSGGRRLTVPIGVGLVLPERHRFSNCRLSVRLRVRECRHAGGRLGEDLVAIVPVCWRLAL